MKYKLSALLCALLPASFAHANTKVDASVNATVVELCAAAQITLKEDTATLQFSYEAKNADKRLTADKVNSTVAEAIKAIKTDYPSAKVITGGYSTYEDYDQKGKVIGWRAMQSFSIETKRLTDVPALTAALQTLDMSFNGVNYGLTSEETKRAQSQLYKTAFDDAQQRLKWMAQGMGKNGTWQIVKIDATNGNSCGGNMAVPMLAQVRTKGGFEATDVVQPNLDSGTQNVQLNLWIQARIK
ncbi:hypothetical protein GCM10009007_05400 [Formosimonas limnophila]|uniref:DUF541 domain-containing protein n=1 Tax=Formosimonas limnophila TaxID=1384487 RepID=A0A8J3CLZ7_9BURK|nr:SIMPL domain-containing protein [Formosimonas limnophila]GHA67647.1 hypothetical protein GCM10009007_05400 [Formosimonas limnophila]